MSTATTQLDETLIWKHVAGLRDAATDPDVVDAILASEALGSVASLLAAGHLDEADELRAAKVLVPRRGTALRWAHGHQLRETSLAGPTQQYLVTHIGTGIEALWSAFTHPDALAALVTRVFPATAPSGYQRDNNREPTSPRAAALTVLTYLTERETSPVTGKDLVAAGLFTLACDRFSRNYPTRTAYTGHALDLVLTVADAYPDQFRAASTGKEFPYYVQATVASRPWATDADAAAAFDSAFADTRPQPTNIGVWQMVQKLEPRLDEARREELKDILRDAGTFGLAGLNTWSRNLLHPVTPTDGWETLPTAELLARLRTGTERLPLTAVPAVVARKDVPDDLALAAATAYALTPEVFAARKEKAFTVALLTGAGISAAMRWLGTLRTLWGEDTGRDLMLEALRARFANLVAAPTQTHESAVDAFVSSSMVEELGRDRVLELPWWVLARAAETHETLSTWVGEAMVPAIGNEGTRMVLIRLANDAVRDLAPTPLTALVTAAVATGP